MRLCLGDSDFAALLVAQHVGFPAAHDAEDPVHEAIGDGAKGLLVMMSFGGHQPPVDLGEVGIDLSGGVGGEHEGAFDAVVAALGDGLARLLGAAAVGTAGEEAAEAADVALGMESLGGMQDAEQDWGEVLTDAGDGAQDVVGLQLGVERVDPRSSAASAFMCARTTSTSMTISAWSSAKSTWPR